MNKRIWILYLLLGLFLAVPTTLQAQVVIEKSTEIVTISNKQYYMHHVKKGETLYSLARVYEVTEDEILRLNPEIKELGLQADMVIGIPLAQKNGNEEVVEKEEEEIKVDGELDDGYVVYTVEKSEKTKRLLRRLDVSEEEFRQLNPSVGSRVFVGQKVLIPTKVVPVDHPQNGEISVDTVPVKPIEPIEPVEPVDEHDTDTIVEEVAPTGPYILPTEKPVACYSSSANAKRTYHVALMVPLYLNNIDKLDTSRDRIERTKNSRALKFLQFYEGFMMAVDSMTQHCGLHIELTVMDVHENVASASSALDQLKKQEVDLIIGPFFSKSFSLVREYAIKNNILIVNPMTEREAVLLNAPNVVKLKPNAQSMATDLADLIKAHYPKAKVSFITENNQKDTVLVNAIEHELATVVKSEVQLSNAEMLELIDRESLRRKMGKRKLSTLEVEGQIFSTKALGENPDGVVYFDNQFQRLSYSDGELKNFLYNLSSALDNVLVAYGSNIVFATKILNNVNKSAQHYPITLIGLPAWSEFDNLLVPNLLNMNAIYFEDHFVDYNDSLVLKFVDDFRLKYNCDPVDYAFEGFDVGWYFLNALMEFGPHATECLPYYHIPLIHTRYYFNKSRYEDGLENRYWSIYQYDNRSIELKPVWLYSEEE